MIPAKERQVRKDRLQRDRRRRGDEWEKALAAEMDACGWAKLWPRGWAGQPFDISAVIAGRAFGMECKRIAAGNLRYSSFTQNEIEDLSRHEDAGGVSIVAVFRDEPQAIRYVPWFAVREGILAGARGSIKIEEYPESYLDWEEVPRP